MADEQTTAPVIDLAAIQAEVGNMTKEQMEAELLKLRTRQKVQQKKHQGGATQKAYQQRQREKARLLKAKAIELGIWDSIEEQAAKAADAKLSEEAAEADTGDEDEAA